MFPRNFIGCSSHQRHWGGMKYPRTGFPWASLKTAGFSQVVSLHPGSYDAAPLTVALAEHLEDLVGGGPPASEVKEKEKVKRAVDDVVKAWRSGHGVVVHCVGGRGRSGTVLGCVLRELGFSSTRQSVFLILCTELAANPVGRNRRGRVLWSNSGTLLPNTRCTRRPPLRSWAAAGERRR
jgi:hypothetical protein